jgi:hypothetical protein
VELIAVSARRAGADGVRYTERQLFYEVCRTLRPPLLGGRRAPLLTLVAGSLPALALRRRPGFAAVLALLAAGTAAGVWGVGRIPRTVEPPLDQNRFAQALAAYRLRHGEPHGLLPPPSPPVPLTEREPDLADYGLARVLVCQDATLAHMLVANMLHLEAECAILSLAAATPLPDAVVAMLMRAPGAQVLVLHDASAEGVALPARAADLLELPPGMPVRSLGLQPAHAQRMHLFAPRGPAPADVSHLPATPREQRWLLNGSWAEPAALRPAHLLRALRRALRPNAGQVRRRPTLRQFRKTGYMTWPER